ncbi:transcriptional regulator, MarR family [Denitrovibrio acetiphilus DSM 12809]|uniref:Transcriptional regulator, MarR family n=1 Tax=Denitrovibrio acetiphilus (strain DSM 12809 / NBRC 114555 / N2460) TaxID=522772 RepID=D4H6X7_DENA2|nr:MarR family transcriptional regulator [Denitrovibrio acetiphilus]ADD67843.1 transcriptional regulator, MarR family [Denitrovibrio acetiphilus DSM 12809]
MPDRSAGKQISHISRSISRYLDAKVNSLNLSYSVIPFLTYLYEHDGVHQDELAANLHYDKSSATRAITALVKQGYVTRQIDKRNKRRNIINVTIKGYTIKDELILILRRTTQKLFNDFTDEEINLYFKLSDKIDKNLDNMLKSLK